MLDDLRSGLRQIRRNPGFSVAAILTLALGVGATTAVFTLADPMLFRPLPYPESARIVAIQASGPLGVADFMRAEANHSGFEAVAEFGTATIGRVSGGTDPALGYHVTHGFFDVLRLRPAIGREFLPDEYEIDATGDAAIITHALWQSAFGGRADILAQSLELQSPRLRRFRIIGVLPPQFVLPDHVNRQPDFLVASEPNPAMLGNPNRRSLPIARLRPGVSLEAASAGMQTVVSAVEREFPQIQQGRQAWVRPIQEVLFGRVRTPLLMLLGATACVLLLACANLAHLFMARLRGREQELGVRRALGAGRWRLARLLMCEAIVFAAAGGVAALLFAHWTFSLIMAQTPEFVHVYRLLPAQIDWRVVAFAAALVAGALVMFGAIPAFRWANVDVRQTLQSGAVTTGGRRGWRGDAGLILVQSAVAIALLVTSALIVRSFVNLAYQPLGFEPQRVRTLYVELPDGRDADPRAAFEARRAIAERLRDELRVPIALAGGLPGLTVPGGIWRADAPPDAKPTVAYPGTGSFFDVMGVRLRRGRLFDDQEALSNAPVAVVDERAATRLWPGEEPLGQPVRDNAGHIRHVIGVVQMLRTSLASDPDGRAFIPFAPEARAPTIVMPATPAAPLDDAIRTIASNVAPGAIVSVTPFRPFERTLGQPRFLAALLGTLGLLTVALTAVGIFGVVSDQVARRTREVGIRIALGASATRIRRMIVRRTLLPATIGVAAGLTAALWWTRTLSALLFGLEPTDPVTFASAAALVLLLVVVAALLPAWRASRLEPMTALRRQ